MEFNDNNFCLDCTVETEVEKHFLLDIRESIQGVLTHFMINRSLLTPALDQNIKLHFSLTLCTDEKMISLNNDHRGKVKTTDVLSFPLSENVRDGDFDLVDENVFLGDIVISHPVCLKQAQDSGLSYKKEFSHLFSHGFLHLIGYDHELSEDEAKIMFEFEDLLVGELGQKN